MKSKFQSHLLCFLIALTATPHLHAEIPLSVRKEGEAALNRGMDWLIARQNEKGHWSSPDWPALTALPVWALSLSPRRESEAVQKGVDYILSHAKENGAIYVPPREEVRGGGKPNYNTAIAMVALHLSGREDARPQVMRARQYIANTQHLDGDVFFGGFGYDAETDRDYADLSNTYIAAEAMRLTEDVEDFRTEGERVDFNRAALADFVSRTQNRPESNNADWVSDHPDDVGGFAYHPESSRGLTRVDEDGKVTFRSFGSMTYAGMLSLIYADVDRNDPRVRSAAEWSVRHWTVEENPGFGQEGYYYFMNVLTKSLAAFGQDILRREDGSEINWRLEVINRLTNLQRIDENGNGYWVNENNRYWEGDPTLVTAYTLIALQVALGEAE
ncbi:MAG: terpene cyclase/mutase family protein [Verrucomicrobia bacterium]|nr:terpene cyclase/mutase family protein [Verrucomicrobiota bacterium]MCH8510332.1 terpene cyclase/mutase family protein [Kiritimatiellia bacterium]